MKNNYYVPFTKKMKRDYTILVPDMLPMHFSLIAKVMENYGYRVALLRNSGKRIADTGLKYVHNDTCYPALLVIGQFIDAIESGAYDVHKIALIMFQTGGGCRASNYISLIRKALAKAGYGFVPVISMSLAGIEHHPGFRLSVPMLHRMMYGVLYADLLMALYNQVVPYECSAGDAQMLADRWIASLGRDMKKRISYKEVKKQYGEIIESFARIPTKREEKPRVGIVGEIFVKYSPLANNHLAELLVREGAEVVVPGLLDFCLFAVANSVNDHARYGGSYLKYRIYRFFKGFLEKKQRDLLCAIDEEGTFFRLSPFSHTESLIEGLVDAGVKMGEGWLLTAEMLELAENGVRSIVCAQPFGCLPNHICGKGMMRPIKERVQGVNIVAIDYDPGMSVVNQENRLKLMLANARLGMHKATPEDGASVRQAECLPVG